MCVSTREMTGKASLMLTRSLLQQLPKLQCTHTESTMDRPSNLRVFGKTCLYVCIYVHNLCRDGASYLWGRLLTLYCVACATHELYVLLVIIMHSHLVPCCAIAWYSFHVWLNTCGKCTKDLV